MHQTADGDPSQGGVPAALSNRGGPQAREPSKCLKGQSYGEDWPSRPSEAQKKTLIGPSLPGWRQSMSPHTWRRRGPRKPSLCATFTIGSGGGRAATGRVLLLCTQGHLSSVRLSARADWPARLLCQRGGSPGKSTGALGQYRLPHPSRAQYFLLP